MKITLEIQQRLEKLDDKYQSIGQDLLSYLDGLLYADSVTYWDYIHTDTLLSLQNTRTSLPDETIFIVYHQITELYFKLILHELTQINNHKAITATFMIERVTRINCYFENLTRSFAIMVNGMEKEQFLKFRMALLPASGFQSVQYRMIEIMAADFIRLVDKSQRESFEQDQVSVERMYEFMYWKQGATELASGKRTLTLKHFDKKYAEDLIQLGKEYRAKNLWQTYLKLSKEEKEESTLLETLKEFDLQVNVKWPLVHYKSAVRYMQRSPDDIKATGGTNWQKYLPPRFQKRIFYPDLWSKAEIENWGKNIQ